jgi:hypothetical protein
MPINPPQFDREAEAATNWAAAPGLMAIVARLAKRIPEVLAGSEGGGADKRNPLRAHVRQIPPQELAAVVVRTVLNSLLGWPLDEDDDLGPINSCIVQDVARHIGRNALRAYVRMTQPRLITSQSIDIYIKGNAKEWGLFAQSQVGVRLLVALHHVIPGMRLERPRRRWQSRTLLLSLTPRTVERFGLDNLVRAAAHRPMVETPKPWSGGTRGGYEYALAGSVPLVRGEVEDLPCEPVVYEALNTLQNTAWRINRAVLAVAQTWEARLRGQPLGVLTENERPILGEAVLEAAQSALHFVHSLDFRGRVYPVATYLSPQGPDIARALLCFAEGCTVVPQDRTAIEALERHGAQCLGQPLNMGDVLSIGRDPVGMSPPLWWSAKEPWQYLAFCRERWAMEKAHLDKQPFTSTLPVWQDATANGLQHMALLLRDKTLWELVNGAKPDVYEVVADLMTQRLQLSGGPIANALLERCGGTISRDMAKSPTMVLGYGGEREGMTRRWVKNQTGNMWVADKAKYKHLWTLGNCFAKAAWTVLKEGPTKNAFVLRTWFEAVARGIGKTKQQPAKWLVPETLFPAGQWRSYARPKPGQIEFFWGKRHPKRHRPYFSKGYDVSALDPQRHAQSLAPNVIHSLDAAHLMMVVRRMAAANLPVATVHDGFATLAVHARSLADIFWEEMLALYTPTPNAHGELEAARENLVAQFRSQCPNIPPFPAVNTLPDIGATRPQPLR